MHIRMSSYIHMSMAQSSTACKIIRETDPTPTHSEAGALEQKRDESMTERIVRGANHCRTALLAGYTTYT